MNPEEIIKWLDVATRLVAAATRGLLDVQQALEGRRAATPVVHPAEVHEAVNTLSGSL